MNGFISYHVMALVPITVVRVKGNGGNSFERFETALKWSQNTNHFHNNMKTFVVAGRDGLVQTPHHVLLGVQDSTKVTAPIQHCFERRVKAQRVVVVCALETITKT